MVVDGRDVVEAHVQVYALDDVDGNDDSFDLNDGDVDDYFDNQNYYG